jgi:hypothetical protein
VVFDETSFPFSEDSNPPTPAAFAFLDDHSNPFTAPFGLSPVSSFSGTCMALPPPPVASSSVEPPTPPEAGSQPTHAPVLQPPAALAGPIGQWSGPVPPPEPRCCSLLSAWLVSQAHRHQQHYYLGHLLDLLQPPPSMEQRPLLVVSAGGCTPFARLLLLLQRLLRRLPLHPHSCWCSSYQSGGQPPQNDDPWQEWSSVSSSI